MLRISLLVIGLTCSEIAHAQTFESSVAIDQAVAQALGRRIGAPGGAAFAADPRLRLARCPSVLAIAPVGIEAVEVRCPDIGWRLRVPLIRSVTDATPAEAVIKRGDTVRILVKGTGFEIATSGIALGDAAIGSGIRVKSVTDSSVFRATVIESGFVEIRD
jgi:flagellar basal body P-ring formation protein FlgA